MAQKTIEGSKILAKQIKSRRNELGLTIEEAAYRAGVGTKTWYRYEAGESIRVDKRKGICKALNWHNLPNHDDETESHSIEEYKNHEAWSLFLENNFGTVAAVSFAVGSDILLDHIKEDIAELSSMSAGSHIGQLSVSMLLDSLPEQFLMHYDYEFLYQMKCTLQRMRMQAKIGMPITAHSVMEELIIYLCNEEASAHFELSNKIYKSKDGTIVESEEWIFDLFGDMDIISFLYSNMHLDTNHNYHFSHWDAQQFYID